MDLDHIMGKVEGASMGSGMVGVFKSVSFGFRQVNHPPIFCLTFGWCDDSMREALNGHLIERKPQDT